METTETQPFLTVSELAALLRVSRATAYALIASGEVPSVRVGGSLRIPRDALYRRLAKSMTGRLP
jgi:excisionase family DNA binding protein